MARVLIAAAALVLSSALVGHAQDGVPATIHGFGKTRLSAQRDLERRFDAEISTANLTAWLERLAGRPHHAGSPHGKANVEFMAALLREWGYRVEIKRYDVLFPTPKTRVVELVAPTRFTARLAEPAVPGDALSTLASEALPTFNMYSADGDVTADLVYVNYGVPADYEELTRRGIDVKGKIVIARYGGSWRGIKPKVAAEHGAIGCLIYSDPRDDGFAQGDVYPKGGWRNEHSAQRGSVADMPVYPGDPLTPGVAATADATRPEFTKAASLSKIPVLPLSYGDARPLLEALQGPVAPAAWRGGLPITYHVGPGPARVHLKLAFDWKLAPAYDVIATLDGAEFPDQWIVRGNHHDGWVAGATDPTSGMVAVLEEARVIAQLARSGWKPRRTLVFAAWDAEEPGLLGSTEWVEDHADALSAKVVAYINSDSNARGFFSAGGSHSLERFVNELARDVPDPGAKGSVADRLLARTILDGTADARTARPGRAALRDRRAGIGLRLHAVPAAPRHRVTRHGVWRRGGIRAVPLDLRLGGPLSALPGSRPGVRRDPRAGWAVAPCCASRRPTCCRSRSCDRPSASRTYVSDVEKLIETLETETVEHNRRVDDRTFVLAANPSMTYVAPEKKDAVPTFDLKPLRDAVERLRVAARRFDAAAATATDGPVATLATANAIVFKAERALTRASGLPRRPWFRHQVYAPGYYTGYGVKTLPAVREALEQRAWDEARQQIPLVAETLERYAAEIERAASALAP